MKSKGLKLKLFTHDRPLALEFVVEEWLNSHDVIVESISISESADAWTIAIVYRD